MLHRMLLKVNLVESTPPGVCLNADNVCPAALSTQFLRLAFVFLTGHQQLYHSRPLGLLLSAYRPLEARAPLVVMGTRAPSRQSRTVEVVYRIKFRPWDLRCGAWVWQ